jgi:uncharacterized lipoprotein YehR (DUF1307 family)
MTKQQAIELVDNNISSIFTKEDVRELLSRIQEKSIDLEHMREVIEFTLQQGEEQFVDYDDITFEVYGTELSADNVKIKVSDIMEELDQQLFRKP